MAHSQQLANCIREQVLELETVEEKEMMAGCRKMDFTGKPMKGWVLIDDSGMRNTMELKSWIDLALDFNHRAKASKKRKK